MADAQKYSSNSSEVCILGSTGSIGTQALEIVRLNPDAFRVVSLSTNNNVELLREQILEFKPEVAVVVDEEAAAHVDWQALDVETRVLIGSDALTEIASATKTEIVVVAIVGFAALEPSLAAIRAGKDLAQANKEMLVAAGSLVKKELANSGSLLCPVDSEHNSLFQCILGRGQGASLRKMTLTASGGPFYTWSKEQLAAVTPAQAVKHPNWDMGAKNSIDSASLMNKGLELIEAAVLFDLEAEQLAAVVHPQSIIHGLVDYSDGSTTAVAFNPSMQVPIAFALEYLRASRKGVRSEGSLDVNVNSGVEPICLATLGRLDFIAPDTDRFPSLMLANRALREGGVAPTVLNAANEVAVERFIAGEIGFTEIPKLVEAVLACHTASDAESLEHILQVDAWARSQATSFTPVESPQ